MLGVSRTRRRTRRRRRRRRSVDSMETTIAGSKVYREKQLEEVPDEYSRKLDDLDCLYCVLIVSDIILYKVGHTDNFKERIKKLGTEFACDHKIIPLMIALTTNGKKTEKKIHRRLHTENGGEFVPPNFIRVKKHVALGGVSKEVYYANTETYDLIKKLFKDNSCCSEIWETKNYVLDDKNYHSFKGWTIDESFWGDFIDL